MDRRSTGMLDKAKLPSALWMPFRQRFMLNIDLHAGKSVPLGSYPSGGASSPPPTQCSDQLAPRRRSMANNDPRNFRPAACHDGNGVTAPPALVHRESVRSPLFGGDDDDRLSRAILRCS